MCRAIIGEAGRLATPSRLASHTGTMNENAIVLRWVEVAQLRAQRPSRVRLALDALRWYTIVATLFPIGVGISLTTPAAEPRRIALAVIATLLAHGAVNLISEAFDHIRGDDSLLRAGGSKVLQHGWLNPRQLVVGAFVLGLVATIAGIFAVRANADWRLFALGAIAVIVAAEIRLPPLALSSTGFGEDLRRRDLRAAFDLGDRPVRRSVR